MSISRPNQTWTATDPFPGNSITFCSCIACGTQVEQIPTQREIAIMWIKDAAAGAGLIVFMASSFLLAGGTHALLNFI